MNVETMIDAMCDEIKQNLKGFCENADLERLTPEVAEQMSQVLSGALAAGGVAGYRDFVVPKGFRTVEPRYNVAL